MKYYFCLFVGYLSLFQSYLHLTFHSCLSRVSLRLGYSSRPIRICNDMSLSFITFLSIFKHVFNISVLKWARFEIIDRCLDCYLHQRLVCLVVKLSFVSLGLLTLLTFKVCLFHLFGLSTGYSFKPLGKAFVILMVSKPERTNNQVI